MIGSFSIGSTPVGDWLKLTLSTDDTRIIDKINQDYPHPLTDADPNYDADAFKDTPSAGTCLEYFNGRLYFAINNFVFCTKAFDIEHTDIRYMVVAGFPSKVTGIGRVNDGLYIGTATDTYFLKGTSPMPEDGGFVQTHISKYGMVYGTICRFQADLVPEAKSKDTVVLWTNTLGVFSGSDGGNYTCLSLNQISMPVGSTGAATIIERNGIYQYIVNFDYSADSLNNVTNTAGNTLTTIVVNLITNAHSRYTNYGFNSFFKFGNNYFGAKSDGVYLLAGDTDDGNPILSVIRTPITDFDQPENKSCQDIFINCRNYGQLSAEIYTDERLKTNVPLTTPTSYNYGVKRKRIKVPTGILGNAWQYVIKNVGGINFTIFDLEVSVRNVKRKI